ncbi:hypothetical protein [Streptomyces sp. NBC_00102]|uniref:hypothetical protein n=1 Tax=Streptomyces sp. NBC_00102 TaxID=2975652 RepID=UPI00225B73C4|nr:hypothetical protein [Streptomyces sp. NBC_00102]MCX5402280.1 hypothetical protein [Streptomyces sp. NBC_00102]
MTSRILPSLHHLDWNDLPAVTAAAERAFATLTDARWSLVVHLLRQLPGDAALVDMCESYDFMDKLVLHDDPEHGFRVRLHRFRAGYFDRPHNHRWPFASAILAGSYRHTQYGSDGDFESASAENLRPLQIRTENVGDWYVLDHTAVHSVTAEAGTISLVLRGPAAKDSFRIIDAPTGSSFVVKGAKYESEKERADKRMTVARLTTSITDILDDRPAA